MPESIDAEWGYYRTLSSFENSHLIKRVVLKENVKTKLEAGHYIVIIGSIKIEYVDLEKERRSEIYKKNNHFYVDPRLEYFILNSDKEAELAFIKIF